MGDLCHPSFCKLQKKSLKPGFSESRFHDLMLGRMYTHTESLYTEADLRES